MGKIFVVNGYMYNTENVLSVSEIFYENWILPEKKIEYLAEFNYGIYKRQGFSIGGFHINLFNGKIETFQKLLNAKKSFVKLDDLQIGNGVIWNVLDEETGFVEDIHPHNHPNFNVIDVQKTMDYWNSEIIVKNQELIKTHTDFLELWTGNQSDIYTVK